MQMMVFEIPTVDTGRLRLRAFQAGDLDAYAAMQANPEVMRYLVTGRTSTRVEVWRRRRLATGCSSIFRYFWLQASLGPTITHLNASPNGSARFANLRSSCAALPTSIGCITGLTSILKRSFRAALAGTARLWQTCLGRPVGLKSEGRSSIFLIYSHWAVTSV
jgi:hypothetical protein